MAMQCLRCATTTTTTTTTGSATNRIESNRIESIAARRVDRAIETTMRRPSRDDATATVARVDARRTAIDG